MIPPAPTPTPSTILTAKEAASYLRMDTDTLYRCAFDVYQPHLRRTYQNIPGFRIGAGPKKTWRFHQDTLDAIVKGTYEPPSPSVTPMRQRRTA